MPRHMRYLSKHAAVGIDTSRAVNHFGTFYNALKEPGVRNLLGLNAADTYEEYERTPVPQRDVSQIGCLIDLLFGTNRSRGRHSGFARFAGWGGSFST